MRRLLTPLMIALLGLSLSPATAAAAEGSGPGWGVVCQYSHSLMDDPIVYPGQPGASHMHDFLGSNDTDAFSTPESLVQSTGTSCANSFDRSGYWFPALMVGGDPYPPTSASLYYKGPGWSYDPTKVRPIPAGLKMLAGDSKATSKQSFLITYWQCGPGGGIPRSPVPYDCSDWPGTSLRAKLTFPSCWDGVNLDSPDHKSHLAYPLAYGSNYCPPTHKVMIVRLTAIVVYGGLVDGSGATLSSGGSFSFHGDFMNGWDQHTMIVLTTACVQAGIYCH